MKTHIFEMPEQQPTDYAHMEKEGGVPSAPMDTRGESNQRGMNRRRTPFARKTRCFPPTATSRRNW